MQKQMNTTQGTVWQQIQLSAPRLVDCSWTQICLEGRILLRVGAVDKSTLVLKETDRVNSRCTGSANPCASLKNQY